MMRRRRYFSLEEAKALALTKKIFCHLKKNATKIVAFKNKTKCKKCGKKGHWECKCFENKKDGDSDKLRNKGADMKKSEAHAVMSKEL